MSFVNLSVGENRRGAPDGYQKRYAVLQSMRAYLDELACNAIVSNETLRIIRRNADDATLLFDDELAAYIKEFFRRASIFQSVTITLQAPAVGNDKARASSVAGQHREWLLVQGDVLTEKFRPVLQIN